MELSLPSRIKILEALSAIADGRVRLIENGAEFKSDGSSKKYRVFWDGNKNYTNYSEGGVIGAPLIATLMLRGDIPYDPYLARKVKRVEWTHLYSEHHNPSKVLDVVLKRWGWEDKKRFFKYSKWVLTILKELKIKKLESEPKLTDFLFDENA